jgi:hypothetical protein
MAMKGSCYARGVFGIDPELGVDSKLIGFGTPCAPPTQPGLVAVEEPAEVAKISVIRPIQ